MGKRRLIAVNDAQRAALVRLRDTAPKAYLRERAAAILKIADGTPAAVVARDGLLRPRHADTVYDWLDRFETEGIEGLYIEPGRGRKPAATPPRRAAARETRAPSRRAPSRVARAPQALSAMEAAGKPQLTRS